MSPTTHTNDSVVSQVSKTPESLIGTMPIFIFLFIMLFTIPTIVHNCNGGCDDEEDDNKTSIEFAAQNNDNDNRDNEDLTESHTVILTSHPIDKS